MKQAKQRHPPFLVRLHAALQAWQNVVPVGLEIIDYEEPPAAAVAQMHKFMASAPSEPSIYQAALKELINDGRA